MELLITRKQVIRILATMLSILITLHLLGLLLLNTYPEVDFVQRLVRQFDLNEKENLPTLFGGLSLLLSAVLLFLIGFAKHRSKDAYTYHWLFLGALFLYISVDESITLHKYLFSVLEIVSEQLGSVIVLLPLILVGIALGYIYWRFLASLPSKTRWRFILSGGLYVGAAFGLQQLDVYYKDAFGPDGVYTALTTLEESLELIGIVLFVGALLDYIVKELPELKLKLEA